MNAAQKIADAGERDAALKKIRSEAPPAPRRVFVGKTADRAATVSLADANGKVRLVLRVDPGGGAQIEFMDEAGKVVQRIGR